MGSNNYVAQMVVIRVMIEHNTPCMVYVPEHVGASIGKMSSIPQGLAG